MFLQALRIENFRAIRKTFIHFDEGTALIGENDCGISSVLDALELALGTENEPLVARHQFHHESGSDKPHGPIGLQLRFRERKPGEWGSETCAPFHALLPRNSNRPRELWYEIRIHPGQGDDSRAEFRLRSPGSKEKSSDEALIGLLRQLNPVVRLSAGMLTGHGQHAVDTRSETPDLSSFTPAVASLLERINRAVESRLSGTSLDLKADLEDGLSAAFELIEMDTFSLGKRESGLSRTVGEIIGWGPSGNTNIGSTRLQAPNSAPEQLGILLLIGALLRARPSGIVPDADPLWILEEPEAHLHPITLTSVAMFVSLIQRQKIVTTYSGDLLSVVPLAQLRRLVRHDGVLHERRVRPNTLSRSELRRFHYHLRSRFGVSSFARFWLLVEGESEYWLIPQIARLMGYEFALEGIACVEFAQCGLDPPIKVARELGIEWHVLTDGDAAGKNYAATVSGYAGDDGHGDRLTVLREPDIEHCFWHQGYGDIYRKYSRLKGRQLDDASPGKVIQTAVRKQSKPFLALSVVEAVSAEDSDGIPEILQDMIRRCVEIARNSPQRLADS